MSTESVAEGYRRTVRGQLQRIIQMGASHLTREVICEVITEELENLKSGKEPIKTLTTRAAVLQEEEEEDEEDNLT